VGKAQHLLQASGYNELFLAMLKGSRGACFVARDGENVVGYVTGYPETTDLTNIKYAELDGLYVDPDYRSQGVGKKLVEAFINWAKNNQIQRIKLDTS